jgi:multiple sugar transport system ATP-binding protein
MADIALEQVSKVYPDGTHAVSDLNLHVADGEVLVLVGPSGCGKSTALKMVAGLEELTAGTLRIGDRVVNDLEPGARDIAMVFQNYALYPHMSVYDNMGFALKLRKAPKADRDRRVRRAAQVLGLEQLLGKKPRQLSGGQRQRVAMGRAIVREPQAFLMDEPLSNLDAKLRLETRTEIARLQRDLGVTMIYVTHDQTEALTLGDRVAVLNKGIVRQVDVPEVVYAEPSDLFVASFIGSPPINLVDATLTDEGGSVYASFAGTRFRLAPEALAGHGALRGDGRRVIVGVRPQDLEEGEPGGGDDGGEALRVRARVDLRESTGSEIHVHFNVDAPPVVTDETREVAADTSAERLDELERRAKERRNTFIARLDARSRVREGEEVEFVADARSLYFFDPETGRRIAASPAAALRV